MTTKNTIAVGAAAIVVAAMIGGLVALSSREPPVLEDGSETGMAGVQPPATRSNEKPSAEQPMASNDSRFPEASDKKETNPGGGESPGPTQERPEEEDKESDEEQRVEKFDSAVDKWMESGKGKVVTMADVDAFRELFRKVPKARKEECVHRALNLIPDDNVMLLAGILFDKEQDKEILNLVYNDILNRDEDVKKPILKEVFKDREHPNWADTAWILEVTGELPANDQDK